MIRVAIVDDHPVVRAGVAAVLAAAVDIELVGEAGDGLDALDLIESRRPDVVVLDLMLPGLSGLEVTRRLAEQNAPTRVVVLTFHADDGVSVAALRAGARGLVLKTAVSTELVRAIRVVAAGGHAIPPRLAAARGSSVPLDPWDSLTAREREVMMLVTEGLQNADVGVRLGISVRTVEVHRSAGFRKLHVNGTAELVRLLVRRGLISAHE